ncbi:MAG: ABC transporter ATP-binding protein, partial [Bradyrhizobium sp.]|nr:ABC transporter ATP-binding protein [Bradyrhizobium sp.]
VLGHNGMGKTTLLRALMGFLPATGGRVQFAGHDITAFEPYRRARLGLGYVPQGREIFPGLTVHENMRMGCSKDPGSSENDTIAAVLVEFPRLKTLLDRPGSALSGGEQQLLAIARCLCGKPRLVLLDEPTEGIQPSIIDDIVETLQRLRERSGTTMILVEQNLDFIAALSQRILVIQKGRITQEVKPGDLSNASLVGEFIGIAT